MRIWFVILLLATLGRADAGITSDFENANALYEQGKFSEAATAYEIILTNRMASPAIYFNLGNAYFKSEQRGRALVAYRQAEKISPRDPEVRANLRFTRNQVQGPTLQPTWLQNTLTRLTLNEWTGLTVTGFWLAFLSLAAMQFRPALKPVLSNAAAIVLGVTLVLAVTLGFAFSYATDKNAMVVVAKDVTVRISPYEEAAPAFQPKDGAVLRVLDRKDDWVQVSAAGRSGWVKRELLASLNGK